MSSDTETLVRTFLTDNFLSRDGRAPLSDTESLLSAGLFPDPIRVLELVAFLESEFRISIADADIVPENFDTIRLIDAFVERKRRTA
jgi:acyl carrier protein